MPTNKRRILIASLAGALALPAVSGATTQQPAADKETVKCYGVNKCKATGDCGGPGHACAGQNSCKRQGYIEVDKDTCLRIDGGRLTASEEAAKKDTKEKKGN